MILAHRPEPNGAKPLWVFLHVPKCGGTTFQAHLANHFTLDEEFVSFSDWGRKHRAHSGAPWFADRPDDERRKVTVMGGHHTYFGIERDVPEPREPRYFTVVRDPADRCVSLYNFRFSRGKAKGTFLEWYERHYDVHHRDYMTRFFAERLIGIDVPADPDQQLGFARQLLRRCWLATTLAHWDDAMGVLSDTMGIPRDWTNYRMADRPIALPDVYRTPAEPLRRHFVLDDATRARIHADSARDLALFHWVREHDPLGAIA